MRDGTTIRFWHEPAAPPCQPFPIGSAGRPAISGDGRYAAFSSCATDLPERGRPSRRHLPDQPAHRRDQPRPHGTATPTATCRACRAPAGTSGSAPTPATSRPVTPLACRTRFRRHEDRHGHPGLPGTRRLGRGQLERHDGHHHQRGRPDAGLHVVRPQPHPGRRLRQAGGLRLATVTRSANRDRCDDASAPRPGTTGRSRRSPESGRHTQHLCGGSTIRPSRGRSHQPCPCAPCRTRHATR